MSFKLFITNTILFIVIYIAANILSNEDAGLDGNIYLVIALAITFVLTLGGILLGIRKAKDPTLNSRKNEIGLYGNALYGLIIILISIFVLMIQ